MKPDAGLLKTDTCTCNSVLYH